MGLHELVVEAWTDRYATWAHRAVVKLAHARTFTRHSRGGGAPLRMVGARRRGARRGASGVSSGGAAGRDDRRCQSDQPCPLGPGSRGLGRPEKFATDLTIAPPVRRSGSTATCGCGRGLVRAVPAQLRRPAGRGRPGPLAGRARLRRPLPAAGPPDRPHLPKREEQFADGRPGDPGEPMGHRLRGGRPHRHRPGSGRLRRLRLPRATRRPTTVWKWPSTTRLQLHARPPLGQGAPRVVPSPAGRDHRLCREPSEEVPGHLPAQLLAR